MYAEGLERDRLELLVDRRVRVGTVVDLVRALLPEHKPRAMKAFQLALDLPLPAAGGGDDLAQVHRLVRPAEQHGEDLATPLSEQGRPDVLDFSRGFAHRCTQSGYNRTQSGYNAQLPQHAQG